MYTKTPFYILSIDGGGVRGIFPAHILKRLEEEYALNWHKRFGMFAGTSTGSIIAAGLACGWRAGRLVKLYRETTSAIFGSPRWNALRGWIGSRYSSKHLREVLQSNFGDITLGQITCPLIIPATDVVNGCVHVFKSSYLPKYVRDRDVPVSDAVLASCSAPTYFYPHTIAGRYRVADGGLWANNPSLIAVADARYNMSIPLQDVKVLSLGTGTTTSDYQWTETIWPRWKLAVPTGRRRFVDMLFGLQSDAAHNTLCLLLGTNPQAATQVMRMTFRTSRPMVLDDLGSIPNLTSRADRQFTHDAEKIRSFLGIETPVDNQVEYGENGGTGHAEDN